MFMDGISYEGDVMNVAIGQGVIKKSGNTYSFDEEKLGVGTEAAKAKLKEDKKLFSEVLKRVRKSLEVNEPQE
jgi:recombination protein RecA